MRDKISIIVPVYNMEKYLDRCMQSLVAQVYQNIEIILVDDGSTDGSSVLCDEWEKRDARVRTFHKKNGGQCTARNLGLEMATGDYIAFVDSDDYVSPLMYSYLFSDLKEHNADISCCASTSCAIDQGSGTISIFTNEEAMREHLSDVSVVGQSPCDKLFKKELFGGVWFPLFRAYEDCATIYRLLAKARKIVYRDFSLYHYIPRENSTMTQSFSLIKFRQIDAYWQMYQDYNEQYPQYVYLVKRKLVGSCQYCIGEAYTTGKSKEFTVEIQQAQNKLRKISRDGLSLKMKITKDLMVYFTGIFGILYRFKKNGNKELR